MSDERTNPSTKSSTGTDLGRRGFLEALVSLPVVGVFFYGFLKKKAADDAKKEAIMEELGVQETGPAYIPNAVSSPPSQRIRLGIIGNGGEGESLVRHAGFAHPDWIEDARESHQEDPRDKRLQVYMEQDDLNVQFTAVCGRSGTGTTTTCSPAVTSTR
jgi:hypothetical protein